MNRARVMIMVLNATFNNILAISWVLVLLLKGIKIPGENHRPAVSQWQTLSQNIVSSTPRLSWIRSYKKSLKIPKGQSETVYRRRTQWPKEKVQNDKQRSTKHTYKTKDRVTRTSLKTGSELRCSGRVSSSCSTSGTGRGNLVTNPVISREWGRDQEVLTTSRTFVTQIFHNGQPSLGGDRKMFEVMTSTLPKGTLGSVASLLAGIQLIT